MDRKARGICAGVLASLAAMLSVGCGADSVPPSTSARSDARPAHRESPARAAVEVEVARQPDTTIGHGPVSRSVEAVVVEPVEVESYGDQDAWPSAEEVAADESSEAEAEGSPTPAVAALDPQGQEDVSDAQFEAEEELAARDEAEADEPSAAGDELTAEEVDATSDDQPTADANVDAENEIHFAMPGSESAAEHPAVDEPSHSGTPRRALIRLAIRPGGAARPQPSQSVAPQQAEPAEAPAAPKSELKPLVVTPIEVPGELAEQPPAGPPQAPPAQAQQLPPVAKPRSPAMIATLARADERVRHGIQLAQKGALYAARREFTTAVKLIAQANDVEHGTRQYTRAAIAGFQAIKEANDLVGQYAAIGEMDVARIVAGHKTKILGDADLVDMPPTVAAGYYYDYAREQLAMAIGQQTVGSIALYGLGKIIVIGAGPNSQALEYTGPAMALYQASLMAEPENFRAAHELGVLLAAAGQLEMARELMVASASKSPQPVIWRNLAVLHTRMGQPQLAEQARQQAAALQQTNPDSKAPQVDWVDPATFAATSTPGSEVKPPATPPPAPTSSQTAPTKQKRSVARKPKPYSEWNPLNLRR